MKLYLHSPVRLHDVVLKHRDSFTLSSSHIQNITGAYKMSNEPIAQR